MRLLQHVIWFTNAFSIPKITFKILPWLVAITNIYKNVIFRIENCMSSRNKMECWIYCRCVFWCNFYGMKKFSWSRSFNFILFSQHNFLRLANLPYKPTLSWKFYEAINILLQKWILLWLEVLNSHFEFC